MNLETRLKNDIIISSLIRKGIIYMDGQEIKFKKIITNQFMAQNTGYDVCSDKDRDLIHEAYEFMQARQSYVLRKPELMEKVHNKKAFIQS